MIANGLWFLAGALAMALLVRAKWQELAAEKRILEDENAGLRLIGKHLGAPAHPATVSGVLEVLDANRPMGVPRAKWFETVRKAMEDA